MPAIQVARTDTFEQQRVKINQIGNQIFNVTAGGSDLSTGNLKLGDGSLAAPSLAFVNDVSLGLYRHQAGTIRYAYNLKKLIDISEQSTSFYRNVVLQQSLINNSGLSILNNGSNYDPGTYNGVSLLGGTGAGATSNIVITPFTGSVTNDGYGYSIGNYTGIPLSGGSGSGATVSFVVQGITGEITDAGFGYLPGIYENVTLTTVSGSGSGATANLEIVGDIVYGGTITNPGSGYADFSGDILNVFNQPSSTFTVTITPNPSAPPDNLFVINGVTQQTLTLIKGRTYRFDLSSTDLTEHPFAFQTTSAGPLDTENYVVQSSGSAGSPGAFIDLIIKDTAPTETIEYFCEVHDGMGATINITTGTSQNFGSGASATVSSSGGLITSYVITGGSGYQAGDTLQISQNDSGGGTSFLYTINSISYSGEVVSCVITSNGSGYNQNDLLSVADSSVGSGGGSGFEFTIQSSPSRISQLQFDSKGSGYSVNDVLSLYQSITNVSTILKGTVADVSTTLSVASTQITVASTTGIQPGMVVANGPDDTGFVAPNTTVASVDSATTLTLSDFPIVDGPALLTFNSVGTRSEISVADATGIIIGSTVSKVSGVGDIAAETTVVSVDYETDVVTLNADPTFPGNVVLSFTPPYGIGSAPFNYTIDTVGTLESITVANQGNGYEIGDTLSVNPFDLTTPIEFVVTNKNLVRLDFTTQISSSVFSVGDTIEPASNPGELYTVHFVKSSGSFIDYILVDTFTIAQGDAIIKTGSPTQYTTNTVSNTFRWFIDGVASPDLTLYVGNTYTFSATDTSNTGHNFSFSEIQDGNNYRVDNVASTGIAGNNVITVSDTTGILPGMDVSVVDGDIQLVAGTSVVSVDGPTQITLSSPVFVGGSSNLSFVGVEFVDGVTRVSSVLTIKITETTPSTLYYYCSSGTGHENEGGYPGERAVVTIDPVNPKVFGSGLSLSVAVVDINDVVTLDAGTGTANVSTSITTPTINSGSINNTGSIQSQDVTISGTLTASTLQSNTINVNTNQITLTGNLLVSNTASINAGTGNIVSSGEITTTNKFNSNNKLFVENSTVSTSAGNDVNFAPATGRVVSVNANTALILPSGATSDRPPAGIATNGAVRFNTDTGQYEGYNASTVSWSSLGGVRDLDGNTFITAEETIGSNDNTLWFYNDNINTVKFTPTHLEFVNQKSIRSINVNAPSFVSWTANTPVTLGQFVKYKNNLYEVTVAGVTASSGSEPTHTTGSVLNGTSELTWSSLAVSPLTFEDIEVLRIGPLGSLPVSINNDLRLFENVVSTDINDLVIRPNSGKKVIVDAPTSLVIPSGADADRGIPIQGSIRFSQTTLQFEGYDGTNWGSLGGVKDVDQNTYIIPELSPGSNENTLYFVNDNNNTLQVTTSSLDFYSIDTIRSVTSNELEITASLLTFDNGTSTFDNTNSSRTFLHTTKQYFDLGLSAGLTIDPILRLDDQGDVYLNTGFGTGVFNGVKVLDGELKEFELADIKILTEKITLVKGTSDNGSSELYAVATNAGCKTTVIAENPTSGDKEFIEFGVLDDGTDVFHTEYGNIRTGTQLVVPTFEVTGANIVRINIQLGADVNPTESVNITVVSNITKK